MVGIIYRSPSQNNFLEIVNKNFPAVDTDAKETYILGHFNINMYENKKYIVHENKFAQNLHLLMPKSMISFVKCKA